MMIGVQRNERRAWGATLAGYGGQFRDLTAMQLARVRLSWRQYLVVSSAMPLGIVLLLRLMGVANERSMAVQVVAGNAVLSVAICSIVMLAQRVAWMKSSHVFDYYATLPVSRLLLLLALLLSYLVFALPGVALIVLLGALLYSLQLQISLGVLPLLLLCGASLAGIGVLIGVTAPDEQLAGLFSNLAMMVVLFLGIVPEGQLPAAARYLALAVPSTYAVGALRGELSGDPTGMPVGLALAIMAVFTALSLLLISRVLTWRSE